MERQLPNWVRERLAGVLAFAHLTGRDQEVGICENARCACLRADVRTVRGGCTDDADELSGTLPKLSL